MYLSSIFFLRYTMYIYIYVCIYVCVCVYVRTFRSAILTPSNEKKKKGFRLDLEEEMVNNKSWNN